MEESAKDTDVVDDVLFTLPSISQTQQIIITNRVEDLDSRSLTELLMTLAPQQTRRTGYCLRLYLPAMRDPVEIWNQSLITIGRRDKRNDVYPNIDLTEHYGAQLGVSRIHAQISYQNATFWLSDLGSKNKTWVNGRLLLVGEKLAISHSDSLRLGHLMIQVGACQYLKVVLALLPSEENAS